MFMSMRKAKCVIVIQSGSLCQEIGSVHTYTNLSGMNADWYKPLESRPPGTGSWDPCQSEDISC